MLDRLQLRGEEPNYGGHLKLYGQIDIALDTFPYNGTAITCESMWMGVPVVSLAGESHVSRVGVSLLRSAGLPELVASTPQEYVHLIVELANDPPRLKQLRSTMRKRMQRSSLMDARHFARGIELAYRQMWRRWCSKEDAPAGATEARGRVLNPIALNQQADASQL